jgi:hypothetical protein
MTKRLRVICHGKVVDTINDDRVMKIFRGEDGSLDCDKVIHKGKKLWMKYSKQKERYAITIEGMIIKE